AAWPEAAAAAPYDRRVRRRPGGAKERADVRAAYRQPQLLVLVAAAVAAAADARYPVRGTDGAVPRRGRMGALPRAVAQRQGAAAGGWRYDGVGIAGDRRIPGRAPSRRVAAGPAGPRLGAQRRQRDACRLRRTAHALFHDLRRAHPPARASAGAAA